MLVHHDSREVQFKIVYCGTPLGGKTTNLQYIHRSLNPDHRGDLVSIATGQNRTLFFDFLPVTATEIGGYQTKFQIYTVPGQRVYGETRELVLKGADGVVFVADSSVERRDANLESHQAMIEGLSANGRELDEVPVAYQFNKRDLSPVMAPEEMDEDLRVTRPTLLACAETGYGVFATLDLVTQLVLNQFHSQNSNRSREHLDVSHEEAALAS